MKNYIVLVFLMLILSSCGKVFSEISIKDQKEHSETFKLTKGDKIRFWTKIKYKTENGLNLNYIVDVYKGDSLCQSFNYNPLIVNPKYMSSDQRWRKSKEKNPDWVKRPGFSFNLLRFKWIRDEDTREDYQKNKYIYNYGIKKNVKGKNPPKLIIKETGNYTFKVKLNANSENNYIIKKAEIILRK